MVPVLAVRLLSTPLVVWRLGNGTCDMSLYDSAEHTTEKAAVEGGNAEYLEQQIAEYWATQRTSRLQ